MVYTSLKFLSDLEIFDKEQPYELFGYPTFDAGKITNCEYEVVNNIYLGDVRKKTGEFTLDTAGFQYIRHPSAAALDAAFFESTGNTDNEVVAAYLNETMQLIKSQTGAKKVVCFDWRFRRSGPQQTALQPETDVLTVRKKALPPGLTMHCDFSHDGGSDRLKMHLTAEEMEAVESKKFRARIINAWRPFSTVENAPLVVTDRHTVLKEDLLEVDKVLPDKVEKAYYVLHRGHHRWYYMSHQTPEDVALFMTWSSENDDTIADFPPHGAAMMYESEKLRESVEVRMIALY